MNIQFTKTLATNKVYKNHQLGNQACFSSFVFQVLELILVASLLKYPVQFHSIMGVQ